MRLTAHRANQSRFTQEFICLASKSGDYEEVRDHMYTKLLGNGTLLLQHVKEDREGYYLCQADNGIGTGIGKVIQLRVNSSPYFSAPSRLVTVKKGDAALLHCDVNGDKPISVVWLKGGKTELNPSTNYRVNVKQDVTPDGVAAELQIVNADAKDSGAYFCQASNMYGRDQQLVQLLVQEPPVPPQGLEAAMISSRSINLKWQHKSGDSNEVFKFIVEFREADRSWHQIELTDTPLPFAALIEDLKPATKYTFHVIAEGPAGRSIPSEDLVVRTEPQRPAGSPLNPAARPISSTEILVTWTPPPTRTQARGNTVTCVDKGFNIGYRTATMGAYNYTSVTGDGEDGGELLLGGLAKYTRYTIVVQAFNEVGAGPLSDPVTAQTMEDVPSMPPEDVRCASLTSQSLQVSWQPPPTEHCNGLLQGYKLTYEPVLDDNWRGNDEMETRKTTALTTVITGLRKFTNYTLQVLAFTKVGDGVLTAPSYCQTEEDVYRVCPESNVSELFFPRLYAPARALRAGIVRSHHSFFESRYSDPVQEKMQRSLEQPMAIKFCVKLEKSAAETIPMLKKAFGVDCLSDRHIFRWHKAFAEGLEDVNDENRAGRPSTSSSDDNVERVRDLLNTDRRLSARLISETLDITKTIIHEIVSESLGMRKVCAKLVPKIPTITESDRYYKFFFFSVPGAPADIKVAVSSPQSLKVSWLPPLEPNGVITKYNLYRRNMDGRQEVDNAKQTISSQHTIFEVKGVQSHIEYQFWVTASTRIGEGQSSRVVSQVATPRGMSLSLLKLWDRLRSIKTELRTVKDFKRILAADKFLIAVPARIISFGGLVVRPWRSSVAFSCESVGSPRREWLRSDQLLKGGANHNQQLLDTGELILSNLQLSDAGNYTCQVDNGQGSDRIAYVLVVQVPPAAPLLYVTSATSSSILLHWKAGANGGAPVSGFTLNYRKDHGNLDEIHLSRHATSFELKVLCVNLEELTDKPFGESASLVLFLKFQGLSCGTTYHLYLTAHNKIGSSPASHPLQARTQGHPPGVPSPVSFIAPNSTSVTLRLHVWPDNGCPILYFILQYRKASESQWILVSNALKPQRKTSITGLTPATQYVVKLEAHNVAGFSTEEFAFMTLTKDGDIPPPDLMKQGSDTTPFYSDMKVVIPLIVLGLAIIISVIGALVCMKHRQNDAAKEQLDNQQNAEAQRERYYATIHKVALQAGEKIPETSEDISPYATFQLSEPSTLPQNTMLHSFMYHEHPITEGCASPPPATSSVQRNSPYYNIQKFQSTKGHGRRRANRKNDVDSEDSESDQDQLTSSRTESSNQLDMKLKHNFVYHGAQSSTSSDISPMSEQKSLPRRNRNRWLVQGGRSASQRQMLSHLSVAETAFTERAPPPATEQNTPDRPELSEAECDIDTLKKLKLGLRSSLWSRPSGSGQPSDYSIAV
ncbi:hypothetical protein NQ318_006725 [Aromia moschata]|uniref:Down syndrome cell adhesion molecule-like protein Dscam2 n=1 Tax=Aromia moschata TaxID=1265417 RepID=A0AAV8YEH8_9CUCU|nr:hypothetical protein NQ318_006725 [Aromia moschata]